MLITAALLSICPCGQAAEDGRIDSVYCLARGEMRSGLPVVSLHLPSLPLISMPRQIASHLVTAK